MPELPEVETIKRQLNRKIKGKKIKAVEVRLPRFVKYPLKKFKQIVAQAKITSISRRAKLLIVELSNEYCLIIHLKLTGQLIYLKPTRLRFASAGPQFHNQIKDLDEIGKHTHLIYHFTDGSQLIHNDLRQFGFVKVIPKKKLADFLAKEKFGPEPLTKEFTLKAFQEILNKRKGAKIKPLLMEQNFLAGLGNLYSDEVLFYARVQPTRKAGNLKPKEIEKIYQGIKKILSAALSRRGTSADQYVDTEGKKGSYLPLLKVYRREGQPCFICQTEIKRLKMSGRSAHFCPKCQK